MACLAYALRARGVQAGDRVLILGPNVPFVSDALQAIPALQAVIVAVNTRLQAEDVLYQLKDSGAVLVLVDAELEHLVKNATVPVVVCKDTGLADDPYEKFLAEGAAFDRQNGGLEWAGLEFQKDEQATFAISYTSGTTSRPKGESAFPKLLCVEERPARRHSLWGRRASALVPHRMLTSPSILAGVETTYRGTYLAALANATESGLAADSVYLWILPSELRAPRYAKGSAPTDSRPLVVFHCLGWCYPFANTFAMSTQVCMRSVDYGQIWTNLLEQRVSHYCGAPTV